jgi:Flp pilus assembly protein TadG
MRRTRQNRGTATVELALCLPLLILLVFGGLEISNLIYVRQGLIAAAHSAARQVSAPNSQRADATAVGEEVLRMNGVLSGRIEFSPSDPATAGLGTLITVTVTAPYSGNSLLASPVITAGDLSATAIFAKEGT